MMPSSAVPSDVRLRLRLVIRRHVTPDVNIIWPCNADDSLTISGLLAQINRVIPLETENRGLEDYAVELAGEQQADRFEFLHFQQVNQALADGDKLLIRSLLSSDVKRRRDSGRERVTPDGKHLLDGVVFGRSWRGTPLDGSEAVSPPHKRARLMQDHSFEADAGEAADQQLVAFNHNASAPRRSVRFQALNTEALLQEDEQDSDFDPAAKAGSSSSETESERHDSESEDENKVDNVDQVQEELQLLRRESGVSENGNGEEHGRLLELMPQNPPSSNDNKNDVEVQALRLAFPHTAITTLRNEYNSNDQNIRKAYDALCKSIPAQHAFDQMMEQARLGNVAPAQPNKMMIQRRTGMIGRNSKVRVEVREVEAPNPPSTTSSPNKGEATDRSATSASSEVSTARPNTNGSATNGPATNKVKSNANGSRSVYDFPDSDSDDSAHRAQSRLRLTPKGKGKGKGKGKEVSPARPNSASSKSILPSQSGNVASKSPTTPRRTPRGQAGAAKPTALPITASGETQAHGDEAGATSAGSISDTDSDSSSGSYTSASEGNDTTSGGVKLSPKASASVTQTNGIPAPADDTSSSDASSSEDDSDSSDDSSSSDDSDEHSDSDPDYEDEPRPAQPTGSSPQKQGTPKAPGLGKKDPSRPQSQQETQPGQGKSRTQKRNIRRRLALQARRTGPASLTTDLPTTAKEDSQSDTQQLEARKDALLASFGERQPSTTGATIPQSDARGVHAAQQAVKTQEDGALPSSGNADSSSRPRSRIDLDAGRRMVFGALGLKNPKTKADEDELRAQSQNVLGVAERAKAHRKTMAKSSKTGNSTRRDYGSDEDLFLPDNTDYESSELGIESRGSECAQNTMVLSEPPFPFQQRWDPQQQYNTGSKRKRQDQEQASSNVEAHARVQPPNPDHNGQSTQPPQHQLLKYEMPANDSQDLPNLPRDPLALPRLSESKICPGQIVAWTEMRLSKSTGWSPQVFWVTAVVLSSELGSPKLVQLSQRDREADEKVYDPVTGRRVYEKFEVPDDPDFEMAADDNGKVHKEFMEFGDELRLVREAPTEPAVAALSSKRLEPAGTKGEDSDRDTSDSSDSTDSRIARRAGIQANPSAPPSAEVQSVPVPNNVDMIAIHGNDSASAVDSDDMIEVPPPRSSKKRSRANDDDDMIEVRSTKRSSSPFPPLEKILYSAKSSQATGSGGAAARPASRRRGSAASKKPFVLPEGSQVVELGDSPLQSPKGSTAPAGASRKPARGRAKAASSSRPSSDNVADGDSDVEITSANSTPSKKKATPVKKKAPAKTITPTRGGKAARGSGRGGANGKGAGKSTAASPSTTTKTTATRGGSRGGARGTARGGSRGTARGSARGAARGATRGAAQDTSSSEPAIIGYDEYGFPIIPGRIWLHC